MLPEVLQMRAIHFARALLQVLFYKSQPPLPPLQDFPKVFPNDNKLPCTRGCFSKSGNIDRALLQGFLLSQILLQQQKAKKNHQDFPEVKFLIAESDLA